LGHLDIFHEACPGVAISRALELSWPCHTYSLRWEPRRYMALILRGRRLSGLSLSAMATFVDFGRWLSGHGMELGNTKISCRVGSGEPAR
jgi:hypothetical protein